MSKYKISIIIPTFNIESDIKRPFNSLLNQTLGFHNLEVIFVDDYSTDRTREIILNYADNYENVKYVFLKSNSGSAGKPRNVGIEYATSDYIMFLDNDDEYVPEACEIFYNKIKESNANLIVGSRINNLHSVEDHPLKISEEPIFEEINILDNPDFLYLPVTDFSGAMWCKIFKTEFLLKNNIKCLEKLPEDVYFMHQCYYHNPNVLFITNLELYNHYYYRVSGTTITVSSSFNFLKKSFIMFDKLVELSLCYKNTDKFLNRYVQLYFNVLTYHIIKTNSNKQQKLELIEIFYNHVRQFDFCPDNKINLLFYKLVVNKKFIWSFRYAQLIKFLLNLKSKFG